jgi:hypothetical protein
VWLKVVPPSFRFGFVHFSEHVVSQVAPCLHRFHGLRWRGWLFAIPTESRNKFGIFVTI